MVKEEILGCRMHFGQAVTRYLILFIKILFYIINKKFYNFNVFINKFFFNFRHFFVLLEDGHKINKGYY